MSKWTRRRPAIAGLIGLAVASAIALVAGSIAYSIQMSSALARTKASEQQALASEQRAIARERAARQLAYCADMRLVDDRWSGATYSQLKTVLERYLPEPGQPDIRGFEWWFCWLALTTDRRWDRVGGHAGGVTAVAMRSDSTPAASSGSDGVVRLWRIPGGELAGELRGHRTDDIDGLAFSPDGQLLASGGNNGEVRIWRVEPPAIVHVLHEHSDWVSTVAFSADGKVLASGGGYKTIVLWDVASGVPKGKLTGHTDTVRSVVFLKKRPLLISASEDATIRAWNMETLGPAEEAFEAIPGETHWVRQLAVDRDETGLWGIVFNRAPCIWDLRDRRFGSIRHRVKLQGNATSITFRGGDKDGECIFGYEDGAVVCVRGTHLPSRRTTILGIHRL